MELPFYPAIPLLGIYPKKPETLIKNNIFSPIFTAVLCTTAKVWQKPKCPKVDERIKNLWYLYTVEYYSAVRKKGNLTFCNIMYGPGYYYAK